MVYDTHKIMKKILFIEDEAALQKTLGDALAAEGFKVIAALDGEVGLRLAWSESPDLILLDLILPKIHGLDVLRKLKENPATRDLPIIILTNLEEAKEVETALALGATTYLVKTSQELKDIIEKTKKILGNAP